MSYVLVVDDEEPIRNLLSRQLAGWGYSVRTASTAMEALELMAAEPAAIALVDLRMPGQDGVWLIDRLHRQWRKTVFVVITAVGDIEVIESSKSSALLLWIT